MATIAIDFDGVLCDWNNKEVFQAQQSVLKLRRQGNKIIIFTARASKETSTADITTWLKVHKVPFDKVTNIKPEADYYIDDRAIRFDNWTSTLEQIEQLERIK